MVPWPGAVPAPGASKVVMLHPERAGIRELHYSSQCMSRDRFRRVDVAGGESWPGPVPHPGRRK